MPFTISHAAVVLPFSRLLARWRLLSAVVIGAMVPDFGLFFPWHMERVETHSVMGLLTFCLPVGVACYWVFQLLIKTPVVELLPESAYARWRPYSSPAAIANARQWLLAACGVLAGAVSHLVWDGFTHENGHGVRMIPWLEEPIVEIGSHHLVAFRLLQDGSSLVGLFIVIALVWYGLRPGHEQAVTNRSIPATERRQWVLIYVLTAVGLSAAWLLWARSGEFAGHSVKSIATGIAVAALRGLAMGLLCTSLCLDWRLRALRLPEARSSP